jgi:hypothetical protein
MSGYTIAHASDAEVLDARVARAVDSALGAGAYARTRARRQGSGDQAGGPGMDPGSADASFSSAPESPFEVLFGDGYVGRPRREEFPTGVPTGDRRLTETARRRATRVLKHIYEDEFRALMEMEIEWLMASRNPGPESCPECGSDDPAVAVRPCADAWHPFAR